MNEQTSHNFPKPLKGESWSAYAHRCADDKELKKEYPSYSDRLYILNEHYKKSVS